MLDVAIRPVTSEEQCVSVTDAARMLNCSTRTVLRKVAEGELRAYRRRLGRETWIPVADLRALVELLPRELAAAV